MFGNKLMENACIPNMSGLHNNYMLKKYLNNFWKYLLK